MPKTKDEEKIKEILTRLLCVDDTEITPGSNLREDLDADSLDLVEIGIELEDAFGITIDDADGDKMKTVADVVALVEKKKVQ